MHSAVLHAVRLYEARFAYRAVRRLEPRHGIRGPIGARRADQRILRRTAAADIGLQVTGGALIRVEARAQSVSRTLQSTPPAHDFDEAEPRHAVLEEIQLVCPQPCNGMRGSVVRCEVPYTGIPWLRRRRRRVSHGRDENHKYAERLDREKMTHVCLPPVSRQVSTSNLSGLIYARYFSVST